MGSLPAVESGSVRTVSNHIILAVDRQNALAVFHLVGQVRNLIQLAVAIRILREEQSTLFTSKDHSSKFVECEGNDRAGLLMVEQLRDGECL